MDVAGVLRGAAALVEKGWCQLLSHMVLGGQDCWCATGAIDQMIYKQCDGDLMYMDHALSAASYRALQHHLAVLDGSIQRHKPLCNIIITWNDAPERKKEEVVAGLNAAADRWMADNGRSTVGAS